MNSRRPGPFAAPEPIPTVQALALFRDELRADGSYTDEQIHELTLVALEGEIRRDGLNVAAPRTTE